MRLDERGLFYVQPGGYRSPARVPRAAMDRLFGWSDTWFYLRIARTVMSSGWAAQRGRVTLDVWGQYSRHVLEVSEACGAHLDIAGLDGLRTAHPPFVYVSNHMSMLETFTLPGLLMSVGRLAIVLKESLTRYPFLGHLVRSVQAVSVSRRNPREDLREVLEKGTAAIHDGRSMILFPQHTRRAVFDAAEFNTLGVKLARRAGVRLVPIAVKTDFTRIGKIVRDMGRLDRRQIVYYRFGEPIAVTGNGREAHAQAIAFIEAHLRAWGAPVQESPVGGSGAAEEEPSA